MSNDAEHELDKAERNREMRLRRKLDKQGFELAKSRSRTIHANNQGGYMITDRSSRMLQDGVNFELTLEDVEAFAAAGHESEAARWGAL